MSFLIREAVKENYRVTFPESVLIYQREPRFKALTLTDEH